MRSRSWLTAYSTPALRRLSGSSCQREIMWVKAAGRLALESATVRSIWLRRTMGMTPAETGSVMPARRARFKKR